MNIRYRVTLTADERLHLESLTKKGKVSARRVKRAQILLAADQGSADEAIAINVVVGTSTVYRTKCRHRSIWVPIPPVSPGTRDPPYWLPRTARRRSRGSPQATSEASLPSTPPRTVVVAGRRGSRRFGEAGEPGTGGTGEIGSLFPRRRQTKQRFVEEGLERALSELPRSGAPRKFDVEDEAMLCAVACSAPPPGRARWTLQLLADEMVRLTVHDTISSETVRRRLGEMDLKPWQKKMWCIPKVDGEFVARMEDVLGLYAEPPDPRRPVVCFDETPRQLIGEARVPTRSEPGKRARYDYEYVRNGTANVFMFVDVNRPWRHAKVTDQRTALDFADCMKDLVDIHFSGAQRIRLVLDNLSTHSQGALYERFSPTEARRILGRIEFHYTPKHASWLNMVEIEIGVMVNQCLDRRIPDKTTLVAEVASWERRRNAERARINWMFTIDRARLKLRRAYPVPADQPARAAA